MLLKIKFAEAADKNKAIGFFLKNVLKDNDAVISYEFLCPYWVSAAIDRGQIIIITCRDEVIWWLRFYARKRDKVVSLYQFAIDKDFRSRWLVKKMLEFTWYASFEGACLKLSGFNDYYRKEGWENIKSDDKYNYWRYEMT
ncbi:MAG: hypothetical protein ACD_3C00035G0008 [uncultured bacterium (gcode 4)]|uniref:N-acetyltransferase domain-containing protein n=1 Tax=uncultured bacterium (gcode 4) TaxID=1234023 RepID=K2G0D9_9BACT|nr:MAG: hypothetical protein ACD_3C00035G0008 [uncultured bacterium (gcode 4)]